MTVHSVAFVGTGPNPEEPVWGESAAMAYRHADGYRRLDDCDLVACADIVREHGEAFADEFGIDAGHVYEDYEEMLAKAQPDIVSVATPVPTHADIVVDLIESGSPSAIHCEKPMADTWADCERMAAAAADADVQLTFNHQRRFDPRCRSAKDLLDEGEIGELRRLEMGGKNLFDFGTHLVDLCNFYNDEGNAEWVLGGLDYREEDVRYGAHNENHAIAHWTYENGVSALAATGDGSDLIGCHNRIVGTEGEIEVGTSHGDSILVRRGPETEEVEGRSVENAIVPAVAHVVESLNEGTEPELSADRALAAMEIIYGAWESVRRRGRVEFPLDIEDNPLRAMVETGDLTPESTEE